MGNKLLKSLAGLVLAGAISSSASATLIFEDNFDAIGGVGGSVLNWTGNDDWAVDSGTVDLVAMPNNWGIACDGGIGKCIDMDGSTGNAGRLMTDSFTWTSGNTYRIEFDLSGNQRSDSDEDVRVAVSDGNNLDQVITMTSQNNLANWQHFSLEFIGDGSTAPLSFIGFYGDNVGAMLDNVRITAVPEPGILGLFGLGLVAMGSAANRRRRRS